MKFGSFITQHSPAAIAAGVRMAEDFGFESAWIAEHLIMPVNQQSAYPYMPDGRFPAPPETPFHDPLLVLAYAAALTKKIRLATGIFVVPLRNAFTTAKSIATLDVLSEGRVIFGVGIGWNKEEFEAVGMKFEDRALRVREYLELMTELWSKEDAVYSGKTVATNGMKFMPKTVQQPHPPIVFGGTTEAALKRVVRLGDGWYGISHSLDETRTLVGRLRELASAAARSKPIEVTISLRTGNPITLEEVRRLADLGVSRAMVGHPVKPIERSEVERFRAEVMEKI